MDKCWPFQAYQFPLVCTLILPDLRTTFLVHSGCCWCLWFVSCLNNHYPVSHCFSLCKPDLMHALSHCMLEPVEYARVVQYDSHPIPSSWSAPGWGKTQFAPGKRTGKIALACRDSFEFLGKLGVAYAKSREETGSHCSKWSSLLWTDFFTACAILNWHLGVCVCVCVCRAFPRLAWEVWDVGKSQLSSDDSECDWCVCRADKRFCSVPVLSMPWSVQGCFPSTARCFCQALQCILLLLSHLLCCSV